MIKKGVFVLSLAFAITLAVVLGTRLSIDALAVIIGLIFGIVAGIPTTLILIFSLNRQQQRWERYGSPPPHQPPIVIVNGAEKASGYPQPPALPSGYPTNGARKWTVIGDEALDD